MVLLTVIIIMVNIGIQVNTEKLFSIFHQDIAKRFDRVKDIKPDPLLWRDVKAKVKKQFEDVNVENPEAKMGYFIHIVPIRGSRRIFQFNQYEGESVIGVPSTKWHLPAAEPILPGHTLSRPTIGMLKSAVSYPHSENGATVYGNSNNLGIRYGIRSGRVLYSNNRRMINDNSLVDPNTSSTPRSSNSKFYLVPVSLNSVRDDETKTLITNILQKIKSHLDYGGSSLDSSFYKSLQGYIRNKSGYNDAKIDKVIRRTPKTPSAELKLREFWNTKNMFNHIKLNANKPELKDLVPPDTDKTKRNWWYFNEDDLSQLEAALRN